MATTKARSAGDPLRVAIVHDWLIGGGTERVVLELHRMYPDAPIYTSYCSPEWRKRLDGQVVTGWLQHLGGVRKFLPVFQLWWFTHLDLSAYDLVISSSGNGPAKGVKTSRQATHICYCHTPTHFYWRHYDRYMAQPGFGVLNPLVRLGLRLLVSPLRRWDYRAAQRPDYYIANSTHIQGDIKRYYHRNAVVIHPPIDVERFAGIPSGTRHGFITAGRQVPLKNTDLAVLACTKLGVPLTVIGHGPEHARLKQLAGPSVTIIDRWVDDDELALRLATAEAFIFASFEDFGIIPVEAMAAGTPVIAYRAGGTPDYVIPGKTGIFFDKQTVQSLAEALRTFHSSTFNPAAIKAAVASFSAQAFQQHMRSFIDRVLRQP